MKSEDELRRERRRGWIFAAVGLTPVLALYLTLKFVTTTHLVPAGSMIPTVHPHDRVTVNRLAYAFGEKPKAGDVAMYRAGELYLHRIVAGPGDRLEMRDSVVFVNGKRRHEPYIVLTPDLPAVRTFGPIQVPPGHYFLMGDNRDNANDSRFQGPIPQERILGRMIHVLHVGRCDEER